MREAIGGAWLLGIAVVIIAVFTSYLAFSVNYAKAFKVKDGIVEKIEKFEGFYGSPSDATASPVKEIDVFLKKIAYNNQSKCSAVIDITNKAGSKWAGVNGSTVDPPGSASSSKQYNYCVERVTKIGTGGDYTTAYYKVTVFYGLKLGFFDTSSIFNLTGETKTIYYPKDGGFWGT